MGKGLTEAEEGFLGGNGVLERGMTKRRVPCWTREERSLAVTDPASIHCNATVFWLSILKWQVCSVTFYFIFPSFFCSLTMLDRRSLGANQGGRERRT